jgi:TatD DNase family protein
MTAFVDSHCHLADAAFDADLDHVVERARVTGAVALVAIGESLAAAARAETIARRFPHLVSWTAGVHPHDAAEFDPQRDVEQIREHLARGAVAVGECGLDYHYDHAPRTLQRRAFAEQLAIAAETGRPVVVHTREAVDDTIAMIREAGAQGIRGVLHCFTGPPPLLAAAVEADWYVSFSGVVTFKKWDADALIRECPADRFLVETDAPYLAPVPHRGKRNEPAYTTLTLAHVAEARGLLVEAAGQLCVANAARLFGLAVARS